VLTRRNSNLKARVVTGAFWVTVETWAGQLLQFGIFVVLSRMLGPEAYGLIGIALLVNVCADILITGGGWGDALVQRRNVTHAHESSLFWMLLSGSSLLAGLVVVSAKPTATLFGVADLMFLMPWLALQLPLGSLAIVPDALLRREMHFAPLVARNLLALAAAGGTAMAMAMAGLGVWSLVAFQLLQPAVAAAVLWIATGWRPTARIDVGAVRDLLPYALNSLGDRAIRVGDTVLLRSVIGLALGPLALGFYTFARKILELMVQLVSRPVSRVMLPSASRLADDPMRRQDLVGRAAELMGLVVFPIAGGIAVVASDLVPVMFGHAWAPAIPMLQALMLVAAAAPFSQLTASILFASGAAGWQLALTVFGTGTLAVLLAAFGMADLAAVSTALVARSGINLVARLTVAGRVTRVDLLGASARALRPLGATVVMIATVMLSRELALTGLESLPRLLVSIAVGALAYGGAVVILARGAMDGAFAVARLLRR
jgi:PST family polysaccharide transporter